MKKPKSTPTKENKLDLEISLSKDTYDSTGKLIHPNHLSKTQTLNIKELKQLEKVLEALVNSGKEHIAGKYLEGFLEARSVNTLQEYLKGLE